ncbi:MAG TPA: hypothetical protein VEL71_02245 [Candidatus Dormibacteraeota bacterium]|nr:hypothetical protein [Candidatus Dormibacteraeota bacterium]
MQAACSFLKSLYNQSLGLVRSTSNSNIYYIASDNLLVEKAFSSCDPTTSQAINQSISSCCDSGYDQMHETLLGVRIHLPINNGGIYTVANSTAGKLFRGTSPTTTGGNYTVLWEVHNATGTFPDCTYADVTVYTALELRLEGNSTGAQHEIDCLTTMFDGRGMVDEAYKAGSAMEHGIYQTYKLALYIYAQQKISGTYFYGEENLFRLQGPDGGFHTGYDQIGTYAGTQENAETTSIALIAVSNLSTTNPFPFQLFAIPSWIIYFLAAWAAIGVGVVVIVLVLEGKKRKQSFQSITQTPSV